jgi:CubicO group peptidase (beta-lactamase class C family)
MLDARCFLSAPFRRGGGLLLLALACLVLPARAQQPSSPADTQAVAAPPDTTAPVLAPADTAALATALPDTQRAGVGLPARDVVEAFFDGLLAGQMDAHHIAGATVAVVQGDSLFFAKGYGFADVEARTPVVAGETLFRIGSVSKLFVWTAVMQLVEEGRLDLDADVNTYLADFKIPETYPEPITLADLMTHTAGFEDQVLGLFARDPARVRPLGDILREELPARVRPPGEVASYSNHGTGLAAYVVEQVSGMPWDDYVEQHILQPLGMTQTTFHQPVPEAFMADLSKGYRYAGGAFEAQGFEYVPLAPVGAASTTATDMGRFMRAHLSGGRLGDAAILDTATVRLMHAPLFTPAPAVNALAHGFYEMSRNGYRVIGHGGDTFWFHAVLALLPAQDVGLFVAFNSEGGGNATGEVYDAFMDEFFPPAEVPVLSVDAGAEARLDRFTGAYRSVRYSHTTLAKLAAAFVTVDVTATDDGRLKTNVPETIYWIETGPRSFREEHGLRRLAFREDAEGDVTHLLFGPLPIMAFERVGLWARPALQLSLAVGALLIFVLALVAWPLSAWLRRRHGVQPAEGETRVPILARVLAWAACLALVAFFVVLAVVLRTPNEVAYGIPPLLQAGLWLPRAAAVLTVLALMFVPVIWFMRWGRAGARIGYVLVVLACGVFLWQLYYWNLLNFPW